MSNTLFDLDELEEVETITDEVKQEEVKTTELIDIKSDQIVVVNEAGIKFKDYDSILKQVVDYNNKYKDFVFTTDDDKKKGKKIISTINANKRVLNDMRIKIKKTILKPVDTLVEEIKTITSNYDETTKNIGGQIDAIEQKARDAKYLLIQDFFNKMLQLYPSVNFISLDRIFDKKWFNSTCTQKKINAELANTFSNINKDLGNIKLDGDLGARVKRIYLENGCNYSEAKKQAIIEVNQERKDQEKIDAQLESEGLKIPELKVEIVEEPTTVSSEPQVDEFAILGIKGTMEDLLEVVALIKKRQMEYINIEDVTQYNNFMEENK